MPETRVTRSSGARSDLRSTSRLRTTSATARTESAIST